MKNLYLLLIILMSYSGFGQVTLGIQDFEVTPATPTLQYNRVGNRVFSTGTGLAPEGNLFASGARGFRVQRSTTTLTFDNINASSYTDIALNFRLSSPATTTPYGHDPSDFVRVEVSTDGGTTYSSELTIRGKNNSRWNFTSGTGTALAVYDGNNISTNFAPTGGGNRTADGYSTVAVTGLPNSTQLRIRITLSNDNFTENWIMDDVKITACPITPENVTALSATAGNQSVMLNWINNPCADEVMVIARAISDISAVPTGDGTSYTANSLFGTGTEIETGEFVVYKGTGNSVNISNLVNNTEYYFKVFTRKGSIWSSGVSISATPIPIYCTASGNTTYDTSITSVNFGSINNVSAKPSGYSDYTSQVANVTKDINVDLSVNVNTDGPVKVYTRAYIDWDHSGTFEGNEIYALGSVENESNGTTSLSPVSILAPSTALLGNTRMRIMTQFYSTNIPPPNPCENNFDGEIEDYTVNVTESTSYTYDDGTWSPSNPIGVARDVDNITILNGNAVIFANTNAFSVTVNPTGALTVDSNIILDVTNNLTLLSTSTNYSSLVMDGQIVGTVNYNRHVNGENGVGVGANDLISPPLSGQTFGEFAAVNDAVIASDPNDPSRKLFGPFEKVGGTYQIYNIDNRDDANAILTAGVGYRAAANQVDVGFLFTGTVNNGIITNNIVNSGSQFKSYNLIGNPYPSYLNVRNFLEYDVDPSGTTMRNIDLMLDANAAIYGYDGDVSTNGDGWVIYNLNTDNSVNLAPGQGFLVTAKAARVAPYDIVFDPSMRRIGSTDDFVPGRKADSKSAHLKLQAKIGTNNYNTDFYFNENSTSGLDLGYDAGVFGSNSASKAIYSHLVKDNTGVDMAIQSLAYSDLDSDIIVPLGINAPQGQQVTVSITDSDLPSNIEIYLEDNVTGIYTLLNDKDYTFTPNSNLNDTGRFFLRFGNTLLSTEDNAFSGLQIYTTTSPRALFIKGQLATSTNVTIYDVQGRVVLSSVLKASSNSNKMDTSNLSSGVYVVKLNNSSQQKTQKVIIR